jgi:hypothetical protein
VHPTPAWFTVTVRPAIVRVPLRDDVFALADALKATAPFPPPLAPLVIVSQEVVLLTLVQLQPVGEVTMAVPVVASATTE